MAGERVALACRPRAGPERRSRSPDRSGSPEAPAAPGWPMRRCGIAAPAVAHRWNRAIRRRHLGGWNARLARRPRGVRSQRAARAERRGRRWARPSRGAPSPGVLAVFGSRRERERCRSESAVSPPGSKAGSSSSRPTGLLGRSDTLELLIGLLRDSDGGRGRPRRQGRRRREGPAPDAGTTGSDDKVPYNRSRRQTGQLGWNRSRPWSPGSRRCAVSDPIEPPSCRRRNM